MNLERISKRHYQKRDDDIPVICKAKNEIAIIRQFLEHHRNIGVRNFLFIDNGSADGTREHLLRQEDCVVFASGDSFPAANFGMDWINHILTAHCLGQWAIYLDCDEHLIYPGMDRQTITDYVASVAAGGHDGAAAVMLDMYPKGSFLDLEPLGENEALVDQMRYFDRDYVVRRRPPRPWWKNRLTRLQILGGPRCRLLSSLEFEASRDWRHDMALGQIDRIIHKLPERALPLVYNLWPPGMPAQQKSPINLVKPGFRYINSHDSTSQNISPTLLAMLHFKFCSALQTRKNARPVANQYYRRGLERAQLQRAVARWPSDSLYYEGSVEYRSYKDVMEAGLMGDRFAEVLTMKTSC